jgi:hypothetical protein
MLIFTILASLFFCDCHIVPRSPYTTFAENFIKEMKELNKGKMDEMNLVITTESQLTAIIENAVRKVLHKDETKIVPDNLSGCNAAVDFLNEAGYRISLSLMQKATAAGKIPCRRFHNKHLVFSRHELLEWAEKNCKTVGDVSKVTLSIATNANNKLRRAKNE